ncbi:hypothetical protein GE061_014900 [Apolygus lucorum]|uniref:Uncharacterized protein n=1 Tax=Apolygus lucorum TaxID=248454 RepID=A0A8S9XMA6_APOLU|nr:hypothetical protein GE061_014900 [Apolygus lucorum]
MRDDEHLCRNRKLFTYVTLQPTVEFTALRHFQLGYPMIGSMVSCIATYLTMFIQFHDLQNKKLTCTVTG